MEYLQNTEIETWSSTNFSNDIKSKSEKYERSKIKMMSALQEYMLLLYHSVIKTDESECTDYLNLKKLVKEKNISQLYNNLVDSLIKENQSVYYIMKNEEVVSFKYLLNVYKLHDAVIRKNDTNLLNILEDMLILFKANPTLQTEESPIITALLYTLTIKMIAVIQFNKFERSYLIFLLEEANERLVIFTDESPNLVKSELINMYKIMVFKCCALKAKICNTEDQIDLISNDINDTSEKNYQLENLLKAVKAYSKKKTKKFNKGTFDEKFQTEIIQEKETHKKYKLLLKLHKTLYPYEETRTDNLLNNISLLFVHNNALDIFMHKVQIKLDAFDRKLIASQNRIEQFFKIKNKTFIHSEKQNRNGIIYKPENQTSFIKLESPTANGIYCKNGISRIQQLTNEVNKFHIYSTRVLEKTQIDIEYDKKIKEAETRYLERMAIKIKRLKQLQKDQENILASNKELEQKVEYQRVLIEPYKTQLVQYEKERRTIKLHKEYVENQLNDQKTKIARLAGHQNEKQKIHHVINLVDKQVSLYQEQSKLKAIYEKQQLIIDQLSKQCPMKVKLENVKQERRSTSAVQVSSPIILLTVPESPLEGRDYNKDRKNRRNSVMKSFEGKHT